MMGHSLNKNSGIFISVTCQKAQKREWPKHLETYTQRNCIHLWGIKAHQA
jgi:hypothetical protein